MNKIVIVHNVGYPNTEYVSVYHSLKKERSSYGKGLGVSVSISKGGKKSENGKKDNGMRQ